MAAAAARRGRHQGRAVRRAVDGPGRHRVGADQVRGQAAPGPGRGGSLGTEDRARLRLPARGHGGTSGGATGRGPACHAAAAGGRQPAVAPAVAAGAAVRRLARRDLARCARQDWRAPGLQVRARRRRPVAPEARDHAAPPAARDPGPARGPRARARLEPGGGTLFRRVRALRAGQPRRMAGRAGWCRCRAAGAALRVGGAGCRGGGGRPLGRGAAQGHQTLEPAAGHRHRWPPETARGRLRQRPVAGPRTAPRPADHPAGLHTQRTRRGRRRLRHLGLPGARTGGRTAAHGAQRRVCAGGAAVPADRGRSAPTAGPGLGA